MPEPMEAAVQQAAADFRFLHWHLAFPDAMAAGGFDCVLGNPPWEVSQLNEIEFFTALRPEIAGLSGAARKRTISALEEDDPIAWSEFTLAKRGFDCSNEFYRAGRFPLCAHGKVNTYQLFAEHFLKLIGPSGRSGVIVPTGIATDNSTKAFFDAISYVGRLVSLYDFENREPIFPGVHRSYKFALLTLGAGVGATDFVFFATATHQLADSRRHFILSADNIALINPNTRTCPVFRSQMDADLNQKVYNVVPVLIDDAMGEAGNPWRISFRQGLFNMTSDSNLFFDEPGANRLPLYEAKMIHQYDHRWASYDVDGSSHDVRLSEKQNPELQLRPRYWVSLTEVRDRLKAQGWEREWLMGWRDICRGTDERTVIASVMPIVAIGHTMPIFFSPEEFHRLACLFGNWLSLVLDFCARNKIGGTHLTYTYLKQFPFLPPSAYDSAAIDFIQSRVLELTYTSYDLKPWAEDLGFDGLPFRFDPERRALLRAELDAFYAHLYGLNRDELRYILDPADVMGPDYPSETFRVLKNNEIRQFGEYRTQRLVLEAWDRLFGGG
jgi:hypothetical protein